MKRLALCILLAVVAITQAATVTFVGVVDQTNDPRFHVGDAFVGTFVYNPHFAGRIQRYIIFVGNNKLVGRQEGNVAISDNPLLGSIYYQVVNSSIVDITLQAATSDGITPPLEKFNLNGFILFSGTFGHLTRIPLLHVLDSQIERASFNPMIDLITPPREIAEEAALAAHLLDTCIGEGKSDEFLSRLETALSSTKLATPSLVPSFP